MDKNKLKIVKTETPAFDSRYFDSNDFATQGVMPDFTLNPAIKLGDYRHIRQDNVINALSLVSNKSAANIDEITGTGLINITSGVTSIEIMIQKYSNTTLKQSTSKLLTLFNMEFTQNGANKTDIAISLRDVASILGYKTKKLDKARECIKKDLEALYNISLEAKNDYGGKTDYIKFRICEAQAISKGIVCFKFTEAIANHLRKCKIMPVPYKLLQIESNSTKSPYAYPLGLKITQLMKMKQQNNAEQRNNDTFIISVEKLLEVCHNYGMPTYEQICTGSRRIEEQIIKPFERDLDVLQDENIFKWDYCKAKGELLTDEELDNKAYAEYIKRFIKVTYPEDYPREEYDTKKAKKAEKVKKKAK